MDEQRRARLAQIMTQLAGGDGAAIYRLHAEFHRELSGVARSIAARQGAGHLRGDELEELVVEIVLELADVAGAWEPTGGAVPWRWAAPRLATRLARVVGQHHRPLDPATVVEHVELPAPLDEPPLVTLGRLAATDARCALLLDALGSALSARDADVLLRYRQQQRQGDPSPSLTVAADTGLRPDTVRQIAARGRRRLRAAIDAEHRFAPLAGLDLLRSAGPDRETAA